MSRWWTEQVARIGDAMPLGLAALLLLLFALLVGAALYWWPAWLPWRWWRTPRIRLRWPWHWSLRWPWHWSLRWPWRRRRRARREAGPDEPAPATGDELPDLPAEEFISLADRLSAQGRFAEAVRERLRAIVRELIDAGLIEHRPGWTVTELAAAAAVARPAVRPGLDAASGLFSDIWYGQRPAAAEHDERMRRCAGQVHAALRGPALVGT